MTSAHGLMRRAGRQRPALLLCATLLATHAAAEPASLFLEWNAVRDGPAQRVAPVLRCGDGCRLHYVLETLDDPRQRLRQAGRLELAPGAARALGRLAFTPRGPHCRVRLTLQRDDGSASVHLIDPCQLPGPPSVP